MQVAEHGIASSSANKFDDIFVGARSMLVVISPPLLELSTALNFQLSGPVSEYIPYHLRRFLSHWYNFFLLGVACSVTEGGQSQRPLRSQWTFTMGSTDRVKDWPCRHLFNGPVMIGAMLLQLVLLLCRVASCYLTRLGCQNEGPWSVF